MYRGHELRYPTWYRFPPCGEARVLFSRCYRLYQHLAVFQRVLPTSGFTTSVRPPFSRYFGMAHFCMNTLLYTASLASIFCTQTIWRQKSTYFVRCTSTPANYCLFFSSSWDRIVHGLLSQNSSAAAIISVAERTSFRLLGSNMSPP